jgi:hypothetical protein
LKGAERELRNTAVFATGGFLAKRHPKPPDPLVPSKLPTVRRAHTHAEPSERRFCGHANNLLRLGTRFEIVVARHDVDDSSRDQELTLTLYGFPSGPKLSTDCSLGTGTEQAARAQGIAKAAGHRPARRTTSNIQSAFLVLSFEGLLHIIPPDPVRGVGLLCNLMNPLPEDHMTTPASNLRVCGICNKPVKVETGKVDELGKAVHEGCYLLKVSLRRATMPLQQS